MPATVPSAMPLSCTVPMLTAAPLKPTMNTQIACAVIQQLVVKGAIALGDGFQPVVKVVDNLGQGQLAAKLDTARHGVVVAGVFAAALQAEGHHRAHVALRDVDGGPDVGLLDAGNTGQIGTPFLCIVLTR